MSDDDSCSEDDMETTPENDNGDLQQQDINNKIPSGKKNN